MTESGVKPRFEAVFNADGLKVVPLTVPAGSLVPEHHANVDGVITVVRGTGGFIVQARVTSDGATSTPPLGR